MQIERLFKPAYFSLETTPSPCPAASSRKRRLNMNVTPKDQYQPQRGQSAPTQNRGMDQCHNSHGGVRGRYNKKFRPPQRNTNSWFTPIPSRGSHQASPSPTSRNGPSFTEQTPPSASNSSVTIRPWSPAKGRVLDWDNL
jgi:hypothetical protein